MCRIPVTFGGGRVITNGSPPLSPDGVKRPASSQRGYHLASRPVGSYCLSMLFLGLSPAGVQERARRGLGRREGTG